MNGRFASALLTILVAACTGQAPTALPTPGPTPTLEVPPEAYRALPGPGTELAPGHYVKGGFTPTVGFAVGEGWTTQHQTDGFFDIQDEPGSLDVVAVQFANVAGGLDAAVDQITSQPNTRVVETDEFAIGGHVGVVAVIETTDPPDSDPPIFRPVLTTAAGPQSIASGRRLWVSLLPVSNGVLAVMVGGSIAEWEHALDIAEPVLESVVISD